eukprot:gene1390-12010_t
MEEEEKRKISDEIATKEEENSAKRSRLVLVAEEEPIPTGETGLNESQNFDIKPSVLSVREDDEDDLDEIHEDDEEDTEEEDEEERREAQLFYQQNFLRMENLDEEALAVYLSTRELNENDYELLLRLDEAVEKKTLDHDKIQEFKTIQCEEEKGILFQNCTVCLENIKKNEIVSILPCKHEFHQDCIETWLKEYSKNCPLCKKEM